MAMAGVLIKNIYEGLAVRLQDLYRVKNPNWNSINLVSKKMDQAKRIIDQNVVLGGISRIEYAFYENDRSPLALFMSEINTQAEAIPAINLHYLRTQHANALIKFILTGNENRRKKGLTPIVRWVDLKRLQIPYKAYRLYKINGINPNEYIPIRDWQLVVDSERSRWQGVFYE